MNSQLIPLFHKSAVFDWEDYPFGTVQTLTDILNPTKITEDDMNGIDPENIGYLDHLLESKSLVDFQDRLVELYHTTIEAKVHILHSETKDEGYLEVVLDSPSYFKLLQTIYGVFPCGFSGHVEIHYDPNVENTSDEIWLIPLEDEGDCEECEEKCGCEEYEECGKCENECREVCNDCPTRGCNNCPIQGKEEDEEKEEKED